MKALYYIFLLLYLTACSSATDENDEIVYIDNGAIQCGTSGLTALQTAQTLIDIGIDVSNSQCAYLTDIAVAALCGLGDTNINVHTIPKQSLTDARTLGYESVSTLIRGSESGYALINCPK